MTDARPLATRTPSRSRAARVQSDATIDATADSELMARAAESAVDEAGPDHSTLSAIKDRLRDV